jgi:hypothetical protein
VTLFQAALPAPRPALPRNAAVAKAIRSGEAVFSDIGCDRCHRPELLLQSREFTEPNPFNPPGNLRPEDTTAVFGFDLVHTSNSPFVQSLGHGQVAVRAFTDLKRHDLNDAELDHFANEQVPQGRLNGFANRPTSPSRRRRADRVPLARCGMSATRSLRPPRRPDHAGRGDLVPRRERAERDAFFALPQPARTRSSNSSSPWSWRTEGGRRGIGFEARRLRRHATSWRRLYSIRQY